jgi:hypothetical protein
MRGEVRLFLLQVESLLNRQGTGAKADRGVVIMAEKVDFPGYCGPVSEENEVTS